MDLDRMVEADEVSQFSNLDKEGREKDVPEERVIDKLLNCLSKKDECVTRSCLSCKMGYDDDHGYGWR